MADLVPDDCADAAVVHGVVGVGGEERRLQDGCREDDLVQHRVVVGVHRLRGHEPLVEVHGLAHLVEVAVDVGVVGPLHVAQEVGGVDLHCRVVDPLVGVADLGAEGLQLPQRFGLGVLAHPVQAGDALPVGLDQVGHQGLHAGLVRLGEVLGHVDLSDGFAQAASTTATARFQRSLFRGVPLMVVP